MAFPLNSIKPLSFPVPFPDVPNYLLHLPNATCESLRLKLGAPPKSGWVDGLGEADFWGFELECGLRIAIECLQRPLVPTGAKVLADSPEIEHVQRHTSFLEQESNPIPPEGLADELAMLLKVYPHRAEEIANFHAWQVWRIDDNGNVYTVGEPTSERSARCWVKDLEARPHKQTYWCERLKSL